MKSWREEYMGRLKLASKSSQTLMKELAAIVTGLDFEYCSYVLTVPVPITKPHVVWLSNYPDNWLQRYFSNRYLEIDPLIQLASSEMRPVVWAADALQVQSSFWEEAKSYNIKYGWAMATYGPHRTKGLLSLARSAESVTETELDEKEARLVWLSHLVHELLGITELEVFLPDSSRQLSNRECEVLRWSAIGKTAEETGKILGITERTVTFHMTSSLNKLNVTNKTQAVAKALSLNLI